MLPSLNLGPHFSKGPLCRRFTLTNSGRRHQSLVWGTEGFAFIQKPKRRGLLRPINPKDMKYRVSSRFSVGEVEEKPTPTMGDLIKNVVKIRIYVLYASRSSLGIYQRKFTLISEKCLVKKLNGLVENQIIQIKTR